MKLGSLFYFLNCLIFAVFIHPCSRAYRPWLMCETFYLFCLKYMFSKTRASEKCNITKLMLQNFCQHNISRSNAFVTYQEDDLIFSLCLTHWLFDAKKIFWIFQGVEICHQPVDTLQKLWNVACLFSKNCVTFLPYTFR